MYSRKHKITAYALLTFALAVASCITVTDIIIPTGVNAGDTAEVTAKFKIDVDAQTSINAGTDLLAAILVPTLWADFADNAEAYFTCSDKGASNLKMTYLDPATVSPTHSSNWGGASVRDWYNANKGFMDNYGKMTWHFFTIDLDLSGVPAGETVNLEIRYKFKTGPENISFNLGVGIMQWDDGPHDWCYKAHEKSAVFTVTGGDGFLDYVSKPVMNTTPSDIRYGDVFSINFSALETVLEGESKVYVGLKAIMQDGTVITYDKKDSSTLMRQDDETSYHRYLYPKLLLGLKQDAVIKALFVNFSNSSGDKVVTTTDGGYYVTQSPDTIR